MILRGESHALRDPIELMARITQPSTVRLLQQLQELYDVRIMRQLSYEIDGDDTALVRLEFLAYVDLMDLLEEWMKQPVDINFSGLSKRKLRKLRASRK